VGVHYEQTVRGGSGYTLGVTAPADCQGRGGTGKRRNARRSTGTPQANSRRQRRGPGLAPAAADGAPRVRCQSRGDAGPRAGAVARSQAQRWG
jgi:hypothetical protein